MSEKIATAIAETRLAETQPAHEARSAAATLAPGTLIDRYQVQTLIGKGAMGAVYRAKDQKLGREVAVKVLHHLEPGKDSCQSLCSLLLHEGLTMARLSHPSLVAVHDIGEFAGCVYVAMEYVEGRTLRAFAAEAGRSWQQILKALLDAGQGLAAAHALEVVHRDFKPDNVLVTYKGRVQVTDFGIARSAHELEQESSLGGCECGPRLETAKQLDEGAVIGTPLYMSPEQHDGSPVDGRSDQFSFAVSSWELLYGVMPMRGETLPEIRASARSASTLLPPQDNELPRAMARVLRRALALSPLQRYPSMHELLEELADAAGISART